MFLVELTASIRFQYVYCSQQSWGKVIFSQASVILSTGGCAWPGGHACPGGVCGWVICGWGVCIARDVHAWGCVCPGGVHAWEVCVPGGHVCLGRHACLGGMHGQGHAWPGGMHGCRGHAWPGCVCGWGACMAGACIMGGHAWGGGMCDTHAPACRYCGYGIRSMSGRYASYWNAFLFSNSKQIFLFLLITNMTIIVSSLDVSGPQALYNTNSSNV